jgi:hypothetical protein
MRVNQVLIKNCCMKLVTKLRLQKYDWFFDYLMTLYQLHKLNSLKLNVRITSYLMTFHYIRLHSVKSSILSFIRHEVLKKPVSFKTSVTYRKTYEIISWGSQIFLKGFIRLADRVPPTPDLYKRKYGSVSWPRGLSSPIRDYGHERKMVTGPLSNSSNKRTQSTLQGKWNDLGKWEARNKNCEGGIYQPYARIRRKKME